MLLRVNARGTTDLTPHEADCRNQAYVDLTLCCTLLVDSAFHYYQYPDSDCWKQLGIFSDPTSEWMQWHHDQFAPYVQQPQHGAERAHKCIAQSKGGWTVLDQAKTNLGIGSASSSQSWDLLHEMVRLMDGGNEFIVPTMPKHPDALPPLPKVHIETLSFPSDIIRPYNLRPLWDLWQNSLCQYLKRNPNKRPVPEWEAGREHKDYWRNTQAMLMELERQVDFCHKNVTKVKDKAKAVSHVLDAWHVKMEAFQYMCEGQLLRPKHKLTVTDVARCFKEIRTVREPKAYVALKKGGPKYSEQCSAEHFLSVFVG